MSSTQPEGFNPLRPYYIPPTIGERIGSSSTTAGPASIVTGGNAADAPGYATKARGVLTDLDYHSYLGDDVPSVAQNVKDLLDELVWKYTSVLMAQPFEVAKILLQIRSQDESAALQSTRDPSGPKMRAPSYASSIYDVS